MIGVTGATRTIGSALVDRLRSASVALRACSRSVIGLWHCIVERELQAAGPEGAILRPHHFMPNLLDTIVFDRDARLRDG